MSAENGGRGKPPVPPEGHGPPEPQQREIPITKEIIRPSLMTSAVKNEDGQLHCSFVAIEQGEAVQYTWMVEAQGQKALLDVLTGGIKLADLSDIPAARTEADKP